MTKFDGLVEEDQSRFGLGKQRSSAGASGRWVIPLFGILGAVVLSRYLISGHSSMTQVLKAAFGAALALAWAVGGAWFGMRRASAPKPLDKLADARPRVPGHREHADESQALRRLECIPDRRYSSLHDLITEIRCD